jgi:hypothetical protein
MKDAPISLEGGLDRAIEVIEAVESRLPESYRVAAFRVLLAAELHVGPLAGGVRQAEVPASPGRVPNADWVGIELAPYVNALAGPGRLLPKALITLEIVAKQIQAEWMTPSEIERFLVERARATHIYRTNVSNALRRAPGLVDRRRRGRAYEYRITEAGRLVVEREIAILGP